MSRHRARELVLRALYERQLGGSGDDAIAAGVGDEPVDEQYLDELWRGVRAEYDALLERVAPKVERRIKDVAPIERGLLVIGAWELAHRLDVPYRVVIDEAVELAKAYGGTDGHKFVNGVLDKLAAELRAAEIRAAARGRGPAASRGRADE
jgi:N utilization substance protein B